MLVVSCLALAYAEVVASVLVDFFRGGVGAWDPQRLKQVSVWRTQPLSGAHIHC